MSDIFLTLPAGKARARIGEHWVAAAILIGAVLLFLGRVCLNYFAYWDDQEFIFRNPHVTSMTWNNLAWFWAHSQNLLYVPVTMDAFVLLGKLARVPNSAGFENPFDPAYFHAASLLVHLAATLVVFNLLEFLFRRKWAALLGALLFALHPVQVETLCWTCGLKDLLAGLFSVLAIWQYLLFVSAGNEAFPARRLKQPRRHLYLAMAAVVLGELSKPSAMMAPAIAAALDFLLIRRPLRRVLLSVLPFVVVAIPLAVVAKLVQPESTGEGTKLFLRPLIAADSLAFYLYKLALPIHLVPDYGRSPHHALLKGWPYWTWIAPLVALAVVVGLHKKYRWLPAAAAVPVIALLPVLGLSSFSFQGISSVADHYLYVAMLGPAILLTAIFHAAKPNLWIGAAAAVLVAFGVRSTFQIGWWRDDITLWKHAIWVTPDGVAASVNLASSEARLASKFQESADNRVNQLRQQGSSDDSIRNDPSVIAYRRELNRLASDAESRTRSFVATHLDPKDRYSVYKAHLSLASALELLNRKPEAIEVLKRLIAEALQLRDISIDDLAATREGLGRLYLGMNDHDSEAVEELRGALALEPTRSGAAIGLALARARMANPARQAAVDFAMAIQSGDMKKARSTSVGSDEKLKWVQTFSDWAVAYRRYQAASARRFAAESNIFVSDSQTMVEQMQDAEQKTEGSVAVLTSKRRDSQPIRVVKLPDGWKVDLDALWKDVDTGKSATRVKAMTQTYDQMSHDLDSGKFATFVESRVELKKRIENAVPPEYQVRSLRGPTTLPAAS